MKIFNLTKCALIAVLMLFSVSIFSQNFLSKDGILIETELTEDQKDAIFEATDKIFNEYARTATFRDENKQFSDETYAEFVSIFTGSAEVFDDLVKKDPQNINYASYADKVYQYMSDGGVNFEINESYIDKITYDSAGFYKVFVSFEKIMYNGLSDENKTVGYPNKGRLVVLNMVVEVPEYDLSQAVILNVLGEAKKIRTETESILGLDFNYHLGSVLLKESTLPRSNGFLESQSVSYGSYGVDLTYRRSINSAKTLFLLAGASVGFHSFSTSLSDFAGAGTEVLPARIGGAGIQPDGVPANTTFNSETFINRFGENSITEDLSVTDIQIPLGISYRIVETYNWDIFVDVALVPTYLLSSSGKYDGGVSIVEFPTDMEKFPQSFRDHVYNENDANYTMGNMSNPFFDEYFNEQDFNENVEVVSNFTASAQITPMVHYKFNYKLGLTFGLNVSYGFLPYFKGEDIGEWDSEDTQLLDTVGGSITRNPSVLQANYKSASILRYGARIGVIFKL